MKFFLGLIGGSLLAIGMVGCVELDETQIGVEEQGWKESIQRSYPSWRPPRVAPPAVRNNMANDYVESAPAPAIDASGVPSAASEDLPTALPAAVPVADSTAPEAVVTNEIVIQTEVGLPAAAAPAPTATDDVALATAKADAVKDGAKVDGAKAAVKAAPEKEVKYSEYTVVAGDSLSVIARKVYKDGRNYYPIIKANESLKKNPNRLYPGMKLRIPEL